MYLFVLCCVVYKCIQWLFRNRATGQTQLFVVFDNFVLRIYRELPLSLNSVVRDAVDTTEDSLLCVLDPTAAQLPHADVPFVAYLEAPGLAFPLLFLVPALSSRALPCAVGVDHLLVLVEGAFVHVHPAQVREVSLFLLLLLPWSGCLLLLFLFWW